MEDVEGGGGADGDVGYVEGRVNVAAEVHVDEVDNVSVEKAFPAKDAIEEIAEDATDKESADDLGEGLFGVELFAAGVEHAEGDEGDGCEKIGFAVEEAPGRAFVADVREVEKSGDEGDGFRCAGVGGEGEEEGRGDFCELVEDERAEGDEPKVAVGADALAAACRRRVVGGVTEVGLFFQEGHGCL